MDGPIEYKECQGNQLYKLFSMKLINVPFPIDYPTNNGKAKPVVCGSYLKIKPGDILRIFKGYVWEPSGPTVGTKNFMVPSLAHDALYQLIRNGKLLPKELWREYADDLLKRMCLERGMWGIRAWYVHRAVRAFGGCSARNPRKVITAP